MEIRMLSRIKQRKYTQSRTTIWAVTTFKHLKSSYANILLILSYCIIYLDNDLYLLTPCSKWTITTADQYVLG